MGGQPVCRGSDETHTPPTRRRARFEIAGSPSHRHQPSPNLRRIASAAFRVRRRSVLRVEKGGLAIEWLVVRYHRRRVRNMILVSEKQLKRVITGFQRYRRLGLAGAVVQVIEAVRNWLVERWKFGIDQQMVMA